MGRMIIISETKKYYEFDGIRLIFEYDQLIGWYRRLNNEPA